MNDTSPETLETLLYKFLHLHELFVQQGTSFADLLAEQKHLVPSVEQQLMRHLQTAMQRVDKTLEEAVNKMASGSVQTLVRASEETQRALESACTFARYRFWRELCMTVGCSVIASLLSVWLLMPRPVLPLNAAQMRFYELGKHFDVFYQALSKSEQAQLLDRIEKRD